MVFVSAASVWKMSIKKAMGKLDVPDNLDEEIKLHRFTPLDINAEHAELGKYSANPFHINHSYPNSYLGTRRLPAS